MVVSIKSRRKSRVCVRYRHCERDAVDVGDGAPGVTRHPGLFHLLVCLCHIAKGAGPRVGRCGLEMRPGFDAFEVLAFGLWHVRASTSPHLRMPSFPLHFAHRLLFSDQEQTRCCKRIVRWWSA
jgi:hypothetical protein